MTAARLRSFGAGLGVSQRDPTSGQQRAKGQLLAVLVESLCPPSSAEAWFSKALVSCQQCSHEQRIARKNVFVNSVSLNVRSWSPCSLCVCKNYVVRAQATSSSTAAASSGDGCQRAQQTANPLDALPDAEHLRAEAAVHGQDWLHAELDGSMKLDKLRAFAAGLGVQQKDPASGSRLSKSTSLFLLLSSFGTLNAQLVHDQPLDTAADRGGLARKIALVNSVSLNVRSWSPYSFVRVQELCDKSAGNFVFHSCCEFWAWSSRCTALASRSRSTRF